MAKSLTPAILECERMYNALALEAFEEEDLLEKRPVISIRSRGRKSENTTSWYERGSWESKSGDRVGEIVIASEWVEKLNTTEMWQYLVWEMLDRMSDHAKYVLSGNGNGKYVPPFTSALANNLHSHSVTRWVEEEFDLDAEAFNLFQKKSTKKKKKQPTRMKLWECKCGTKVRSTRDLTKLFCEECETNMEKQE